MTDTGTYHVRIDGAHVIDDAHETRTAEADLELQLQTFLSKQASTHITNTVALTVEAQYRHPDEDDTDNVIDADLARNAFDDLDDIHTMTELGLAACQRGDMDTIEEQLRAIRDRTGAWDDPGNGGDDQ